ncbi:MAG: DUF1080 domain-containing protein [Candidatus Hydrogenedentes bacterium]|nr:DUF1080 domain-containing protein [Candidatus Hydrogenedentota bacterium]
MSGKCAAFAWFVVVVLAVSVGVMGCTKEPEPRDQPPAQAARQMAKPGIPAKPPAPAPAPAPVPPPPPPAPAPEEAAAGPEWIVLFNGSDLAGWQNARDPQAENKWLVEDGVLTNVEHGNDIATVDQWKDFDLQIEYKTVPEGNSGIYLRGRIEIQVYDSHGKEAVDATDAGAIYGQFAPLANAAKPAGEWNLIEASYHGDRLTVKLNGQLVQDKTQITELTGGALPGGVNDPGPLMLQGDHGKVWYRNIKIRPAAAPEEAPPPAEEAPAPAEGAAQ